MSKFQIWVNDDHVSTSVQTATDFVNDSQRQAGFQSGNPASSIRVNTALRQANLIAKALMDLANPANNSGPDVTSSVDTVKTSLSTYLASLNVASATNVTTNINGNAISNIFEANGLTAKNATNVTTNINSHAISSIFESDGVTAKAATKLKTARTITVNGNGTNSSGSFDGSGNVSLTIAKASEAVKADKIAFTTIVPTAAGASGTLTIYYGTTVPSTMYDNILYLIGY